MKSLLLFLLIVISLSCSKYKLNQPCTLQFQSDYISTSNPIDENYSGSLNVTSITFSGEREKGDAVEIKKVLETKSMEIGKGIAFDTPIDIPVGIYTNYNVKIRLSDYNSIRIEKNITNGINKPILIEINEGLELIFLASEKSPELKKKEMYTANLIWNLNQLFAGLSNQSINNAPTVLIDGIETVVVNTISNPDILIKIKENLPKAIQLIIE